jgi:hypothetical protein
MSKTEHLYHAHMQTIHKPMKKYRVAGTFSYFADGDEDDEKLKEIDTIEVASSKDEAAEKALEDYEHDLQEPSWLFGYPTIEFLEDVYTGPSLRDYWTKAM